MLSSPLWKFTGYIWTSIFWNQLRGDGERKLRGCLSCSAVNDLPLWTCILFKVVYSKQTWLNVGQYSIVSHVSILRTDVLVLAPAVGTWGHRFKLAHSYSSLEWHECFFSMRCVSVWNSLPDGVVALDSVDTFKTALHFNIYSTSLKSAIHDITLPHAA